MNEANDGATKTWVLALTSAGSLMAVLDAMVVATALNTMRVDLNASMEALEWTMNAYNLSFAVLLLTGAALGDRFGRARMFVAGLVLFVAASVACALAGSPRRPGGRGSAHHADCDGATERNVSAAGTRQGARDL